MNFTRSLYQLGFEISPIILKDGLAKLIPGKMLPIVAVTEASNFTGGLLHGSIDIDLSQYFCHFSPAPGGTLVNNQIGTYPFANQTVAANAIVAQPLTVSMIMTCPVSTEGGHLSKFLTMNALVKALNKHNLAGGTYIVATPSYIYTDCILTGLRDISDGSTKQAQNKWQFDFVKPLIALDDADQQLNALIDKITSGVQVTNPTWSGLANQVGSAISWTTAELLSSAKSLMGLSQ